MSENEQDLFDEIFPIAKKGRPHEPNNLFDELFGGKNEECETSIAQTTKFPGEGIQSSTFPVLFVEK